MAEITETTAVYVADVEEFKKGIPKEIFVNGESIAFFKTNSDKIRAIRNSCPHKGGPLSQGIVSGDYVFCPLHDWKISTVDGKAQAPDVGCTHSYSVQVEGNSVYIQI
ncbi:nitrite reductase small subunit NirD [Sinobaca sp. H24]|uniref:nitrite reductase small subunit NirD n=1 Tax=Sinobaca sp. H24 TaxID=2923376 RepID=UPI00207990A9|nr:nitrite reductase small subunit NirD [Sinobaca sp. H24]